MTHVQLLNQPCFWPQLNIARELSVSKPGSCYRLPSHSPDFSSLKFGPSCWAQLSHWHYLGPSIPSHSVSDPAPTDQMVFFAVLHTASATRASLTHGIDLGGLLDIAFLCIQTTWKSVSGAVFVRGEGDLFIFTVKEFQPFLYSLNKHVYGMKRAFGKRINFRELLASFCREGQSNSEGGKVHKISVPQKGKPLTSEEWPRALRDKEKQLNPELRVKHL